MQNFEQLGRELEKRGKTDDIKRIADSPEGQRIGRMVDSAAVEQAARTGDSAALRNILGSVLATEDGKRLAESIRKMMEN